MPSRVVLVDVPSVEEGRREQEGRRKEESRRRKDEGRRDERHALATTSHVVVDEPVPKWVTVPNPKRPVGGSNTPTTTKT